MLGHKQLGDYWIQHIKDEIIPHLPEIDGAKYSACFGPGWWIRIVNVLITDITDKKKRLLPI